MNTLAILLDGIFKEIGDFESRTLWFIINDISTSDSGRSIIHKVLVSELSENPILGLGIFGAEATFLESHGLYLDIFINFGYIIGAILLFVLFFYLIRDLKKFTATSYGDLLLLFSFLEFPKGFFAGSFFGDKEIWIIMGLLLSNKVISNKVISNKVISNKVISPKLRNSSIS